MDIIISLYIHYIIGARASEQNLNGSSILERKFLLQYNAFII